MKTGEDITLAYSVRHHAKVPVIIFDDGDDYQGELVHLKPLFSANLAPFLAGFNRTWSCINTEGSCGDDNFVQMVATEDRRRGYMVNDRLLKGSESQHVLMRRRLLYHLWQQGWTLTTTRFFLQREGDRENAMLGRKYESFCSDHLKRRPSSLGLDHGWCVYSKPGEPCRLQPPYLKEPKRQFLCSHTKKT